MATKITNAALIAAGEAKLKAVQNKPIPYVEMDCQALVEALLVACGVPARECNLSGSNAHYRACVWRGTPEECVKQFGAVPGGAFLFIVEPTSDATPAKYCGDGMGDANHMYVYLGGGRAIHSSQSRGGVCESTNFKGTKTVPNGGVNYVGLSCWVDYGLSDEQESAVAALGVSTAAHTSVTAAAGADTREYYTVKQGCLGGAVRRLQGWLGDLGAELQVDGEFGPATDAAVRAFQTEQSLAVDGVVGQRTWAALADARAATMAT